MRTGRNALRCGWEHMVQRQRAARLCRRFVYNAQGKLIRRIRLPEVCANLCFGGPKRNQLFMTASQSIYMLQVATQGAAPG